MVDIEQSIEAINEARHLQIALWTLATEYQDACRFDVNGPEISSQEVPRHRLDRNMLSRLYRTLHPESAIDNLRRCGLDEIAGKLENLAESASNVFTSTGHADDALKSDVQNSTQVLERALWEFDTRDWSREEHIGNLRGIDNAGLLDEIDASFLTTLSGDDLYKLYDAIENFSADRAIRWQYEGDGADDVSKAGGLAWAMHRAGEPTLGIAETVCQKLGCSNTTAMRAMAGAGVPDASILDALGVSMQELDEALWRTPADNAVFEEPEKYLEDGAGGGNEEADGGAVDNSDDYGIDADNVEEAIGDIDPIAQMYFLGHAFFNVGDLSEALSWYRRAAEAGSVDAMAQLGALLVTHCAPPDLLEARRWDTKAAECGDVIAMYNLGVLLADLSNPPEISEARLWFEKAAHAGHAAAMFKLGLLAQRQDPTDLPAARIWYERGANAGNLAAMNEMGKLLANANPPDFTAARKWFEKAARAGNTDAMYNLGIMLAGLSPPHTATARMWLQRAADQGSAVAAAELASVKG